MKLFLMNLKKWLIYLDVRKNYQISTLIILGGKYKGIRECHIKPDDLLVYWVSEETQTLYLERIGSHSDLF